MGNRLSQPAVARARERARRKPGRASGQVMLGGTHIGAAPTQSPFSITIYAAAIDAAMCSASGAGILRPAAGDPAAFVVQVRHTPAGTALVFANLCA